MIHLLLGQKYSVHKQTLFAINSLQQLLCCFVNPQRGPMRSGVVHWMCQTGRCKLSSLLQTLASRQTWYLSQASQANISPWAVVQSYSSQSGKLSVHGLRGLDNYEFLEKTKEGKSIEKTIDICHKHPKQILWQILCLPPGQIYFSLPTLPIVPQSYIYG